ncbi:MAG TPA: hypothetical protein PLM73_08390 [Petrotogaceae bacterium]|nr:hypothetical protein [Petrotogaceae bacterium]HPX15609.1 hypothetical protein [Petrotogaceae bacterium]HQF33710.1 hypothetical protein [Petrotogaceae bacterium]HQI78481.1 hypothetical protein [Petrotogaceae bacterium]
MLLVINYGQNVLVEQTLIIYTVYYRHQTAGISLSVGQHLITEISQTIMVFLMDG